MLKTKKPSENDHFFQKTFSLFWGFLICHFGELTYSEIKQYLYYTPPQISVNLCTLQTFESFLVKHITLFMIGTLFPGYHIYIIVTSKKYRIILDCYKLYKIKEFALCWIILVILPVLVDRKKNL